MNKVTETGDIMVATFDVVMTGRDGCEVWFLDDDEINDEQSRIFRISLPVPKKFFEPVKVNIEVNKELVQGVCGDMTEVQIPVSVEGETKGFTVTENLTNNIKKKKDGLLLGFLKRTVEFLEK